MAEQSGEAQLAIFVGSKIADGIVGGAASELVANPVLSFLGIKKEDDSAQKYHDAVMNQLATLGQSLGNQVRSLQTSLNQIKSISSNVEDYMTQEALAQVLRAYNTNATTIESLFQLFVDDVSALSDADTAEAALTDLYNQVLSSDNALKVSEAMSTIHDLVGHPSAFDKGILDYLHDMIQEEIQKYAETDESYVFKFTRAWDPANHFYELPRDCGDYYECGKIVINAHDVARAELPKIASLFKRIISTQLRGLIFLAKAWEGSIHAPTLRQRTKDVLADNKLMQDFYPAYRATVDKAVADSLKKNGKSLPDELLSKYPPVDSRFRNHDWIMMKVIERFDATFPIDEVWLVYQPWIDTSQVPAGADRYALTGVESFPGSGNFGGKIWPPGFTTPGTLDAAAFESVIYRLPNNESLKRLGPDLPAELAAVLNGLPTSEEEVIKANFMNLLQGSQRGLALSFKCVATSDTGGWLEGRPASGTVGFAPKRGTGDANTSTKWRVFFTLMPPDQLRNVCVKCLGFNEGQDKQYLNGPCEADKITSSGGVQIGASKLELALNSNPEISKGTEWIIRPWPDNTISITRPVDFVDTDGTVMPGADVKFLEGKADGSVALSNWAAVEDQDHMKWIVYPYIEDSSD